jgi:predicted transcriptional regulator
VTDHGKVLRIDVSQPNEKALLVLKALASESRLRILAVLGTEVRSVNQLAQLLDIPVSTAAMHVKELEEAELIHTELQPASRGQLKACSRRYDQVLLGLPPLEQDQAKAVEISMPIGAYVRCEVSPTCGLASDASIIGMFDDPISFLEPERLNAQILWFRHGFVEYQFPYRLPPGSKALTLQIRMEICSEAPTHNLNWPSDITLWINNIEIGTWTSPGDFGGSRGALTPSWWLDIDSQYGQLKRWEISESGAFVDGMQVSDVKLADLRLGTPPWVTVRLGVKADARNVGGLNLFGRKFGNYPEDLTLRITYK